LLSHISPQIFVLTQKIVSEIEKIESKINQLVQEISAIPQLKEAVLKKYL